MYIVKQKEEDVFYMVANYRVSKGRFKFRNPHPKGSLSTGDCVIRALSIALGKSWKDIYLGLNDIAIEKYDLPNSLKVYTEYLNRLGIKKEKQPKKSNNKKYTVDEFAKMNKNGTYICNISGHIVAISDGYYYDTWDCGDYSVGNYWKVD